MNSFLKTVNSMTKKRNVLIKESLQKQLNTCVMEMQGAPGAGEDGTVGICDESMTLCSVLEAIFLHGLKDSLLNRVTEVLSGPDFDAMPQPSFWGPLLIFSHRQIIDQIQALSQLTTEVGYSRAWIRLALNEGLLANYFCSIRRDNSALKPYYSPSAFIRDTDLVEVAQRLIENLDYVHFELACNSSLLNFWSNTPLLLAGIWSPPMKSCPVFSAVDIAKTITTELTDGENFDEVETASSIGSLGSFDSSQTALNNVACIKEDEALKIILANARPSNTDAEQLINDSRNARTSTEEEEESLQAAKRAGQQISSTSSPKHNAEINAISDIEDSIIENIVQNHDASRDTSHDNAATAVGNSLIRRLGWSTSFEDCESPLTSSVISPDSATDAPRTPGEGPTYDSIIQSYHTAGNASVSDVEEFLKKYPKKEATSSESKVQPESKV